jgi:hypothetical protein
MKGNAFVTSDELASELKQSDNYFVIVTRERLENLPYSVDEIQYHYVVKKNRG